MPKRTKIGVNEILMAIPSLTESDRRKVSIACQFGLSKENNTISSSSEDESFLLFYDTLASVLRESVGGRKLRSIHFQPRPVQKQIREAWEAVEALYTQIVSKTGHRTRIKFYHLVLEVVVSHIRMLEHVPVSVRTISQFSCNCGTILDTQFPNYKRAGLLHLIMKWGTPGTTPDEEEL